MDPKICVCFWCCFFFWFWFVALPCMIKDSVSKPKEVIITFHKAMSLTCCVMTNGADVHLVDPFKLLRLFISIDLSWASSSNCSSFVKRCHMCLHFLRQLKRLALIRGQGFPIQPSTADFRHLLPPLSTATCQRSWKNCVGLCCVTSCPSPPA